MTKVLNSFMSGQIQMWLFFVFCALGSWAAWSNEAAASADSRRISALALLGFLAATQLFIVVAFQTRRIQIFESILADLKRRTTE